MFPIALPRPARIAFLAASTLLHAAFPARAGVTTFAQFTNNGVNVFRSSNVTASATFNAGSIPWRLDGLNLGCLPADLQGNQTAPFTLSPGTGATETFTPNLLDFSQATPRDLGLSFPSVLASLSIQGTQSTAAGTGTINADPVPLVVPEADARPALGYLVGLAGLWEIFRRLRNGWARAGREEEMKAA